MCNSFQNKSPTHTIAMDWDTWHGNWAAPCYFNGASPTGSPLWCNCLQRHLACEYAWKRCVWQGNPSTALLFVMKIHRSPNDRCFGVCFVVDRIKLVDKQQSCQRHDVVLNASSHTVAYFVTHRAETNWSLFYRYFHFRILQFKSVYSEVPL